ncbi:MAG: methionyl-tRNA formyltransferase [Fuerstiella sp.]
MRIGWVGVHAEGIPALQAVCEADYDVVGMATLRQEKADRRCGSADYEAVCERYDIPLAEIDHINDPASVQLLQSWNCDLLVVLGWGQILGPEALRTARIGVVGAHASLLPHNRGSAPVNWAIIRNESQTGNSLIWLTDEVDSGHLIDQRAFDISAYDTCQTIYEQVAESNREMLLDLCLQLAAGERPGQAQRHSDEPVLPRRRPQDGLIDWNTGTEQIYNMVRALTRPYPGAFTVLHGRTLKIWQAAQLPLIRWIAVPGTFLGSVQSPLPEACGQLVATSDGAIVLLEVEDESGHVLKGRELSEQNWSGRSLSHAA